MPGGYKTSTFIFRVDGILEVRRTFGNQGALVQTWRISYDWNEGRTEVLLGKDPKLRPPAASLKGYVNKELGIFMKAPTQRLPIILTRTDLPEDRLRLGKKTYRLLGKPRDKGK
jgi:hypothetical protein